MVDGAHEIVLPPQNARCNIQRCHVTHQAESCAGLRCHQAREDSRPGDSPHVLIPETQLGRAERSHVQQRRHLRDEANRKTRPGERQHCQVCAHCNRVQLAYIVQRMFPDANADDIAFSSMRAALATSRVCTHECPRLEQCRARRTCVVSADQSTHKRRKPLNAIVKASVARFKSRERTVHLKPRSFQNAYSLPRNTSKFAMFSYWRS